MNDLKERLYLVRDRKGCPNTHEKEDERVELQDRFFRDKDGGYQVHNRFFRVEDYRKLLKEEEPITDASEHLESLRKELNWSNEILDVTEAWNNWAGTRGKRVRIAVLDTGVDEAHPALKPIILDTKDFTGSGVQDDDGHGTHCAGIIAAQPVDAVNLDTRRHVPSQGGKLGRDSIPFWGVAPEAKLLIGKVLKKDGDEVWGEPSWVVEGIRWAIKQGADIISMSFAGRRSSSDLYFAIQQALWLGKFVICAAGNDGFLYQNGIGYPGRYGGVITVAAHDRNGNPAGFSSRGGEVDVVGPGEDIWSTFRHNGWSGYAKLSGTSMAAPFVAGLAALIVSKHKFNTNKNGTPLTNNEDLKEHLLRLSTHPGHHDAATGYGVLRPLRYFEGGQ